MSTAIKHFTAAKAILHFQSKILLLRESAQYHEGAQTGKYDVPGGRLEPGEDLLDGLKREIREETGLDILSAAPFFEDDVVVQKPAEEWHIKRIYLACDAVPGDVVLSGDHDEALWIDAKDHISVPIIENLHEVFAAYTLRHHLP